MVKLPLSAGFEALVDSEDYERLSKHKWSYSGHGYAHRKAKKSEAAPGKTIYLHNEVMGGVNVDHINGNGLDCRKENLRFFSGNQNHRNAKKAIHGKTSSFKGVCFNTRYKKWTAQISVNNRTRRLGIFDLEIDAAKAYNTAAVALSGEFARLNNV